MVAELKPYPAYKDSGVEWLGDVPRHWRSAPVRRYCRVFSGATPSRTVTQYWDNGSIPWLASGDVNLRRIRTARQFITEAGFKNSGANWIRSGSLVIALAGQGKTKGMVATVEFSTTCNQSLAAIEPANYESRYEYLAYYLESRYQDIRALVGDGLRDGLNLEHIKSLPTPLPPLPEQAAAVRFLGHADRRIQRYIRTKEKLIALLEEQKQTIIHQAVTGQIDVRTGQPYSAYKPSGVEWLGDVPAHWEVLDLGRLITLTVGFPFKSDGFTQSDGDIRLLRGINIAPGRIRWGDVVRWSATDAQLFLEYQLEAGDIVLGMDRPIIVDGIRVALVDQSDVPSLLLQRVARLRPERRLLRDFVFRFLSSRSFKDYLAPIFTGISVPHLSPEQIRAFRVALPSVAEQQRIVDYLHSGIRILRLVMKRTHDEIALLREYRTRLITDVVTGKLDVREAAAQLPDENDKEPIDEDRSSVDDVDDIPCGAIETAKEISIQDEVTA